jgi:hypothetical protein
MNRHIVIHRVLHIYASHPCIINCKSGDWLVAFCSGVQREGFTPHPPDDPQFVNSLTRSRDQGQTWEPARVVPNYANLERDAFAQSVAFLVVSAGVGNGFGGAGPAPLFCV